MEIEHIYKILTQKKLFKHLKVAKNKRVIIPTNTFFSDHTERVLNVEKTENGLILTDLGQTIDVLNKSFELTEPDVVKLIKAATNYYGIGMIRKSTALPINSIDEFPEGFIKTIYCTNFTDNMSIYFY